MCSCSVYPRWVLLGVSVPLVSVTPLLLRRLPNGSYAMRSTTAPLSLVIAETEPRWSSCQYCVLVLAMLVQGAVVQTITATVEPPALM